MSDSSLQINSKKDTKHITEFNKMINFHIHSTPDIEKNMETDNSSKKIHTGDSIITDKSHVSTNNRCDLLSGYINYII